MFYSVDWDITMTNMNVYWNEDYCGANTEFETLKKSKYIALALNWQNPLNEWIEVKDPADKAGALAEAHNVLVSGLDPEYLQAVMTGRPRDLAETNGFKWDNGIYQMVLNSTAGILSAIQDVASGLDHACSLSSGLHHARRNKGDGYCTVNSLALGALYARKLFENIVILDLDAHCGGGTNEYLQGTDILQVDYSTSGFDAYESNNNSQLTICKDKNSYIDGVEKALTSLTSLGPDLVIYNAGVDIYPFVEPEIVHKRERMVADRMRTLGVPTVIVMAGGYGDYKVITDLHLKTIMAFASPHLMAKPERVVAGQPTAGQFV